MRGRLQAATVALIGSWFPLVSPAVVALVSLRKGAYEGSLTLVWAMMPALFTLVLASQGVSDMGPLMPFVTLIGLLVVFLAAQVLRLTISWSRALTGLVALSVAGAWVLAITLPNPVQSLTDALGNLMRELQSNAPEGAPIASPDGTFVLGLIAYVLALSSLGSVLLARWAQAKLYNPGGFRQEFHQLRLAPVQALVCAAAAVYCLMQPAGYQAWASVFSLPLLLAGIALIHAIVHARKMAVTWLVMLYIGLFLVGPLTVAIACLGIADTWLNLRNRLNVNPPSND